MLVWHSELRPDYLPQPEPPAAPFTVTRSEIDIDGIAAPVVHIWWALEPSDPGLGPGRRLPPDYRQRYAVVRCRTCGVVLRSHAPSDHPWVPSPEERADADAVWRRSRRLPSAHPESGRPWIRTRQGMSLCYIPGYEASTPGLRGSGGAGRLHYQGHARQLTV